MPLKLKPLAEQIIVIIGASSAKLMLLLRNDTALTNDHGISFRTWHALADHCSVVRARQRAFEEAENFRAAHGGKLIKGPASLEELGL